MAKTDLTAQRLRELLNYDPETGVFTWRVNAGKRHIGERAGTPHARGYISIRVKGRAFLAHRLAWLYVHGEWPGNFIDHMDANKRNNAINNLRNATHAENQQNQKSAPKHSTSGILGAHWDRVGERWVSFIRVGGKGKYLGSFKTSSDAQQAYIAAKRKLHPFGTL